MSNVHLDFLLFGQIEPEKKTEKIYLSAGHRHRYLCNQALKIKNHKN